MGFDIYPLTVERWQDFETLFKSGRSPDECWCMWWRLTRAEWEQQKGEGNRLAMRRIVESGEVPGLLAYSEGEVAGWVSVAPRERFPKLERHRILARIDEQPAWSMVCFFVGRKQRGKGLLTALTDAGTQYAIANGARIIEAYPRDDEKVSSLAAYRGVVAVLQKAGFEVALRRSPAEPILRRFV